MVAKKSTSKKTTTKVAYEDSKQFIETIKDSCQHCDNNYIGKFNTFKNRLNVIQGKELIKFSNIKDTYNRIYLRKLCPICMQMNYEEVKK